MSVHSGGAQHSHEAGFDLARAALEAMQEQGFHPGWEPAVAAQLASIRADAPKRLEPKPGVEDLRLLRWSSIDNDTSRDLDQIEVAERMADGRLRLTIAIGDVAAAVEKDSPVDRHAREQTQTVHTAVRNFPMLPVELSTDLTSLNEGRDRLALIMRFTVSPDGDLEDEQVGRALVRNRAQLAYSRVGPWLDEQQGSWIGEAGLDDLRSDSARADAGTGPAEALGWLGEQLHLQDEAAQALHRGRLAQGALEFAKAEADPVVADGRILNIRTVMQNRAMHLVEDLMVAANGVMARALRAAGRSGLQRVVRVPARWDRMVTLAAAHGTALPAAPDSGALNRFLQAQHGSDPDHYADLALAMIKLMGGGEYMLMRADDDPAGHFGLAARDYTHSTAPNRRFPDLVTQRVLHAMLAGAPPPYSDDDLAAIAAHCNETDRKLRKIERSMIKRVAAVALAHRLGELFRGVVTGATGKGVYVRVIDPPFEGRIVENEAGLDVGDRVQVKLLRTDHEHAFIDLARV